MAKKDRVSTTAQSKKSRTWQPKVSASTRKGLNSNYPYQFYLVVTEVKEDGKTKSRTMNCKGVDRVTKKQKRLALARMVELKRVAPGKGKCKYTPPKSYSLHTILANGRKAKNLLAMLKNKELPAPKKKGETIN